MLRSITNLCKDKLTPFWQLLHKIIDSYSDSPPPKRTHPNNELISHPLPSTQSTCLRML